MFFDPFTFTPPSPEVLTRAVESYQRVAAARFCRYARDAMDPDLLPIKVRGDLLDPTPKQLHAEVRALRHLTAIQRTLRDIGGPLFDPASPVPPEQRFRLVDRRLDAIEEALGAPSACSASSSSDFSSDFSSSDSADKPDFYHPPEIEDLLEAVNFAQTVFAARAELLDKRRLTLSPEDFLLEIASLRDLTAIVRTLRRMSAKKLQEDATPADIEPELADAGISSADSSTDASPQPSASAPTNGESPSNREAHAPLSDPSESSDPSDASHPSHQSHRSHPSHDSSESVSSVKSVDHSSSSDASASREPSGLVGPVPSDLRLRPVPRIPEVRPAVPSPAKPSSHPSSRSHPSHTSSESVRSVKSVDRSSSSRFASLYQEEDLGPWGIWDTPPPEAIDESSPEFLADMKRFGYVAAWRRAAARLAGAPPPVFPPLKKAVLNDSDPPLENPP